MMMKRQRSTVMATAAACVVLLLALISCAYASTPDSLDSSSIEVDSQANFSNNSTIISASIGSEIDFDTPDDPSFCTWNGYNFSTLSVQTQISVKQTMFFIRPCLPLTGVSSCGARSSSCFVATHHHAPEVDDLGDVSTQRFAFIDPLNTTVGVEITMTGENDCVALNATDPVPFETRVLFVCAPALGNITVTPNWNQCIITFTQPTPLACSNASDASMMFEQQFPMGQGEEMEEPSPLFPENASDAIAAAAEMDAHAIVQSEWEMKHGSNMTEEMDLSGEESTATEAEEMMEQQRLDAVMNEAVTASSSSSTSSSSLNGEESGAGMSEEEMEFNQLGSDAAVEIASHVFEQGEGDVSSIFGEAP